jgi:apolipoprotein N-acyltransferase
MGTRARENKPPETPFRRAGAPPPAAISAISRPGTKFLLLLLGVALLTLSFAPFKLFYLAPFGLVPWLLVLNACRTRGKALLWSWLAGVLFFAANMWWLVFVTVPGTLALVVILGLYWAGAGFVIRETGLLPGPTGSPLTGSTGSPRAGSTSSPSDAADRAATGDKKGRAKRPLHRHAAVGPLVSMFGIAVTWVAMSEWLRATWPFGGLPWLFLGYTQSPLVIGCQIADITGVLGVSFYLALINAWMALFVINRLSTRDLLPAGAVAVALLLVVMGYGWYRLSEKTTYPGPTVLVVQSNYPQSNTGEKGASARERVEFHESATVRALNKANDHVDLVVWSETMMPPLNSELRDAFRGGSFDNVDLDAVDGMLMTLAGKYHAAFLVGGEYAADFHHRPTGDYPADVRNSAYYYERDGRPSSRRYDKIHRVPFGEYIPFKESAPWLYHLLISLGPPDMEGYQLRGGDPSQPTVFALPRPAQQPGEPWRFVTPICFEDIDGSLVAWMFRKMPGVVGVGPDPAAALAPKQADFIVNVTNDGWFKAGEMPQHLQAAVFRSIEDRAPTARSVNTGISGFIDSSGRIEPDNLIPAGTEGSKIATLQLDRRTTFYTRRGDVFADLCATLTGVLAVSGLVRWRMSRK